MPADDLTEFKLFQWFKAIDKRQQEQAQLLLQIAELLKAVVDALAAKSEAALSPAAND